MVLYETKFNYHDNVQLTFYKCSCEYTCISAQQQTQSGLHYSTLHGTCMQHATHYKVPCGPFSNSWSRIVALVLIALHVSTSYSLDIIDRDILAGKIFRLVQVKKLFVQHCAIAHSAYARSGAYEGKERITSIECSGNIKK